MKISKFTAAVVTLFACWVGQSAIVAQSNKAIWRRAADGYWDATLDQWKEGPIYVHDSHPELGLVPYWDGGSNEERKANGEGVLIWKKAGSPAYGPEGVYSRYRGAMQDGMRSGQGTLLYSNGDQYVGAWEADLQHGEGVMSYSNGDCYRGPFRFGQQDGEGEYAYANGDSANATFRMNQMNGKVIFTFQTGQSYEGRWENGAETDDSKRNRAILLAQVKESNPGLVVAVDQSKYKEEDHKLGYRSSVKGGTIAIGPQPIDITRVTSDCYTVCPVYLEVTITNKNRTKMVINGGAVEIDSSVTDLSPVVSFACYEGYGGFRSVLNGYGYGELYGYQFANDGWGAAKNLALQFNLQPVNSKPRLEDFEFSARLGTLSTTLEGSLENELAACGVDTRVVRDLQSDWRGKITEANAKSIFGRFARFDSSGKSILSHAEVNGQYTYSWVGADGESHNEEKPIREFKCWLDPREERELGAAPMENKEYSLMLDLDRSNYRVPFAFKKVLKPGQIGRIGIGLVARKSSDHRFRIVLQSADGNKVVSPNCKLHYVMTRSMAETFFGEQQ